jgi:autotransporter strand-loop-strand O-heptosyltransferase
LEPGIADGLAWAAGTKVVMISGFTHPTNEFTTPYRVINWHTCNGCLSDVQVRFDRKDPYGVLAIRVRTGSSNARG